MITANQRSRTLDLYEVMEKVEKASSRKDKIELLRQYDSAPLRDYLRCVFDDRVHFNLPGGEPPYTQSKEESYPSSWMKQNKKLKYLVKGLQGDQMNPIKRESIFIGILESVHPKEAEVLVKMINKKAGAKGLTKKVAQEAFPNLIK